MGEITDMNTRALENAMNYEDAELQGLFDSKEFCTALSNLIDSKGIRIKDILDFSNISKSYLTDIRDRTKNIQPKRNKILDLCLGMNASKEEINTLLRLAHYQPLDSRGEEIDRIIIWGLAHKKSNLEIRDILCSKHYYEFAIGGSDE